MNLADVGWVWEGVAIDPGVPPSVLGIGEGCEFFGLRRANYMFHPNTEFALSRLAWLEEVTCDITKWKWRDREGGGGEHWVDGAAEAVKSEAAWVSHLSCRFPNVTGVFHDDMLGLVRRCEITPEQYAEIRAAAKSENPALKLWAVIYTHELDAPEWADYEEYVDVLNLWVWESKNLPQLDAYIERCRERFAGKALVMGCYLRDYTLRAPVPMELLKLQWEFVLKHLEAGVLDGFSILGATLIDSHIEQATWVRDFIRANS
jgi:hypothetical protein